MKKYLITIIGACAMTLSSCGSKDKGTIIVGVSPDYPPFTFMEKDKKDANKENIVGFEIDLFNELAKRSHYKVIYKQMPFDEIFKAIEKKEVDASIANITVTDERKEKLVFSKPYLSTGYALVVKDNEFKSFDDLKNKKVVVQENTSYEKLFKDKVQEIYPTITVEDGKKISDLVQKLKDNYVDAIFLGKAEAEAIVFDDKKDHNEFILVPLNMDETNDLAIAYSKDSKFVAELDKALEGMLKDDTVNKLKEKWSVK
jgi:ABC-type amino acid transport substrate-binding protein